MLLLLLILHLVVATPPYKIKQGTDGWCRDANDLAVHQSPPSCGRVCSSIDPTTGTITRGVYKEGTWSTEVPCSACPAAEWPGCPKSKDNQNKNNIVADASTIVGMLSATKPSIPSNPENIKKLVQKQKTLGMDYANGIHHPQSFVKAKELLNQAMLHDNPMSSPSARMDLYQIDALEKLGLSPNENNENNPSENKSIDENDTTKKSTPTTDAQQQNDVLAKNQALVTIEKRKKEEDQIYKKIFSSDSSNIVSNSNAFRFASMKATPAKVKCTVKKRKSTSSDKNWNDVYERAEYWCQCSSNKPINTNIGDDCEKKNNAGNLQAWVKDSVGGCHSSTSDGLCHSMENNNNVSPEKSEKSEKSAVTISHSNKATHTYDAVVPIYWTNNAKELEQLAVVGQQEEEKKKEEEVKIKEDEEEKKTTHAETAKQTAVLAGIAGAVVATEKIAEKKEAKEEATEQKIEEKIEKEKKEIDEKNEEMLGAEIPYIVNVSKTISSVTTSQSGNNGNSNGDDNSDNNSGSNSDDGNNKETRFASSTTKHQKRLRWDERKARTEAKRHQWQRSPYVCPLSTMRMTK